MDTKQIINIDKQYHMNTYGERIPIVFDYGNGCILYDKQGKQYIDFLAGIAVNTLGYNHPALVKAIKEQAEKVIHCSNLFYIEAQAKLEKILLDKCFADRIFFTNSGAEANEGAIKLAKKYFKDKGLDKHHVITAANSFHGRTLATLAATGQEKYHNPFIPLPTGFISVDFNDVQAIENSITEKTCAVMLELIQGEGGIITADYDYIQKVRKICDKYDLLLIFDEVQTGIGRTGKLFAYQHYDVQPDIITMAKALGGGVPIGAFAATREIASAFKPGDHGSTFGGNPLVCSAAAAVLETIYKDNLLERCSENGKIFKQKLIELKNKYHFIKSIRGKGLMLGLELDKAIDGKDIVNNCVEKGFIINCAGNNTLRFVPPLIIELDHIQKLIEVLDDIFQTI